MTKETIHRVGESCCQQGGLWGVVANPLLAGEGEEECAEG